MRISTRTIDETLIVDLIGPFPRPGEDLASTRKMFRDALSGRTAGFIVTLDGFESLGSTDIGVFISLLSNAGVDWGGFRVVASNERVAAALQTTDGPIQPFETEEEALASLRSRSIGFFWGALIVLALVLFFFSHCAT